MPGSVALEFRRDIAIVTLKNEGRLNAMDEAVAAGLAAAVAAAKARSDIGALILRGAGDKAFCAGVDLKYARDSGNQAAAFAAVGKQVTAYCRDMAAMPFPTIALLEGVCYGGGVQLAAMADFRFAATSLKLAIPAVKNRLFYPIPALARLAQLIGPSRMRRLILEGEAPAPATLLGWGLIDEVLAPDAVEEATLAFATRLAAQPRDIIRPYMDILRAVERGDGATAETLRQAALAETGRKA
jgi:enoyl-CoA hydratase/carnithine racemase